ncbi:uncharacterized protein LOC130793243 [Actinidia eriantha]|uniref:uncharacterized protein LOC130793243 n=1 Tax=Actinidia eriantha TaxID=165200 RepID=UPI002589B92B|nr:uncharacterized protein LOC130793243 [Actinidia eriantha]
MDSEIRDGEVSHRVDNRRSTGLRLRKNRWGKLGLTSSMALHAAYVGWYGLLIDLIQINYQNSKDSPFETQPASMPISILAICFYGFGVAFKQKFKAEIKRRNCMRAFKRAILISGVLSPASLISVLLPNGLGWIVYTVWAIFAVIVVAWNWILVINQWPYRTTVNATYQLVNKFARFSRHRSVEEYGPHNV